MFQTLFLNYHKIRYGLTFFGAENNFLFIYFFFNVPFFPGMLSFVNSQFIRNHVNSVYLKLIWKMTQIIYPFQTHTFYRLTLRKADRIIFSTIWILSNFSWSHWKDFHNPSGHLSSWYKSCELSALRLVLVLTQQKQIQTSVSASHTVWSLWASSTPLLFIRADDYTSFFSPWCSQRTLQTSVWVEISIWSC